MTMQNGTLVGKIVVANAVLVGHIAIAKGYTSYDGVYEITPKITAQHFNTKDKVMKKDLLVESIPYYEVENLQNGITVTIGEE